ncbi:MAG TPA: HAD family hydrolase [Actinopolymorphaceae bacterium]
MFFDVDQTLCDFESSMRRAVSSTVEEIRRRHPSDASDHLTDGDLLEARNRIADTAAPATSMEQIRRQSLAAVFHRVDPDATAADLDSIAAFYFDARFDRPSLYPDAVPALEILSTRYRLGIITNGNSYPRHPGLHRFFTEVLLSTDVGVAKPDPAIYRLAGARVGQPHAELVMVGDSQVNDVDAAVAAG